MLHITASAGLTAVTSSPQMGNDSKTVYFLLK